MRNQLKIIFIIAIWWIYIPHILAFCFSNSKTKHLIKSDLRQLYSQIGIKMPVYCQLIWQIVYNRYYRNIFYYRIGVYKSLLLKIYCPEDRYFTISRSCEIGEGLWIAHPYATNLSAKSIGKNFHCIHCTTLGKTYKGTPIIGDNVHVGANVCILGDVKIGDNVQIGAGSVVVKDIPSNVFAAGNPAKIIRYINQE